MSVATCLMRGLLPIFLSLGSILIYVPNDLDRLFSGLDASAAIAEFFLEHFNIFAGLAIVIAIVIIAFAIVISGGTK